MKNEKLSFSLAASSKPRKPPAPPQPSPHDGPSPSLPEYVTVFDPSQTLAPTPPTPVISPLANTAHWRAPKRMKNLLPPSSDAPDSSAARFVLADADAPPASVPSYGLTLRSHIPAEVASASPDARAALASLDDAQRFKADIGSLPEHRGMEEFQDMPVEDFGRALLAGYGWKEGQGIGRNHKQDVKVSEQKRWTGNSGLGYDPGAHSLDRGNGERMAQEAPAGRSIRVVAGKHAGMKGEVLKEGRDGFVLSLGGERVSVGAAMVAELGSAAEERCLRKLKEADRKGGKKTNDNARVNRETKESVDRLSNGNNSEDDAQVHWLRSQIKVKVISREFKKGRLYLKKGVVMDVIDPVTCDISMDESRELVQGVNQKMLQTALPPRGGAVLVLYGRHKGVYGRLVEKDRDNEVAVVKDEDSHELVKVQMDQIAEYVGDPDDIGY